ncbi:DNA polymerase III subunit gamma/tau [Polyangium aurulentum]|uniref:DNA polymerase III subunit gamma/tau n=1 Tax=Polyangium aurulentum TaxID=2567896 RepID=UPI0010AE5D21|nr:DNA polymerase III subunit gamma/tau [Polyangium aurulentum]UQA60799.1 DNA polymerase III subunit gamma/tau [Polyangium aurulentum]
MSYVVLARKWRPQSFEDLVGQGHVSATLANAIARNRVAHAFLFTGVRGVGKTTSARILAKALNCANGPTATPCQKCAPCLEITTGSDVDVQEIDGASYTGVDDVRKLQESLPYRPSRDRFKIFIVDEVHMLSNNAWNAFLKTLEEPPPHVKFIFATTEVHKIPVTILSRCQRYDFKLLSAQTIAARLRYVLEQENVAFEDGAVAVIAREAAGSMRDAMSLLDQVLAWVGVDGDKLTGEGVARVLGVADRSVLHGLAAALVAGDASGCLRIIGELAQQGYDLPHVARDFLAHLRDLVVAKVCDDVTGLLDLADSEVADVKALAAKTDGDDLARLHQGFSRSFDDIVRSGQPRASLEMALVRLARRPALIPVDELLRRLGDLERRLVGTGGGSSSAPAAGSGPDRGGMRGPQAVPPMRRNAGEHESGGPPARRASPAESSADPPPARAAADVAPPAPAPARPQFSPPPMPVARGAAEVATFAPPSTFPTAPPVRPPAPPAPPPRTYTNGASNGTHANGTHANGAYTNGAPARPAVSVDLTAWRSVLELVRAKRPPLASVLEHAALIRIDSDGVVLGFEPNSFLGKQAQEPAAIDALRAALATHFGGRPEVTFEGVRDRGAAPTLAQLDSADRKVRLENARRAIVEHPLVTAAIELLGAELRDVRLSAEDAELAHSR